MNTDPLKQEGGTGPHSGPVPETLAVMTLAR